MKYILRKLIKTSILLSTFVVFTFVFSKTSYGAEPCIEPINVGTLSTGRTKVTVGWSFPSSNSVIVNGKPFIPTGYKILSAQKNQNFTVNYSGPLIPPIQTTQQTDYTYKFSNLQPDTVYYWKLRISCNPLTNNDVLSAFLTVPALKIKGFLFVDGTITLARRVEIDADFSYFRSPIFEILTQAVGSGRLHIVDIQ